MATTKATTAVEQALTLSAGAADDVGANQNIGTGYGAMLYIKLTNGATGPTVPAQVQVQVSADAAEYMDFGAALIGGTANLGVSSWAVAIPAAVENVRTVQGSNTGQAVTCDIDLSNITAIS